MTLEPTLLLRQRKSLHPWFHKFLPSTHYPGYTPKPFTSSPSSTSSSQIKPQIIQLLKLLSSNPLNAAELLFSITDGASVLFCIFTTQAIREFESKHYTRLTKVCLPNTLLLVKSYDIQWLHTRRFLPLFGKYVNKERIRAVKHWGVIIVQELDVFDYDQVELAGVRLPLCYEEMWYRDLANSGFDYDKVLSDSGELAC